MAKMNKRNAPNQPQQSMAGGGGGVGAGKPHSNGEPAVEPPDVFCSLGSLVVEGRLPAGEGSGGGRGGRGYYEGPHVELPGRISRHKCSNTQILCNKNENFRKHMILLWQNNVPMSIEVLLCSDCGVGQQKARSVEVTTVPEPGSILIEQWTIAMCCLSSDGGQMDSLSLLQAVRSYLHFSQLSAWYSKTAGALPRNVLIRITIPGEEFASKFTRPPEEHFFPTADVGYKSSIAVSVRSLPRSSDIPAVVCSHNSSQEEAEEGKLAVAGAVSGGLQQEPDDLRRSLVKSKLALNDLHLASGTNDCPGRLAKSDSMDSMLGDSLLDPPQSLARMAPRRYQSPSRCGSPSLEAPDHLLGGRRDSSTTTRPAAQLPSYEQAMARRSESPTPDSPDHRLNRHNLLRRRDLNLFHGLHPRLLHGHPRLSLPPRPVVATPPGPLPATPCQPPAPPPASGCLQPGEEPPIVDDRMQVRCNISGKHICQFEEELDEEQRRSHQPSPPSSGYQQAHLGAKPRGWTSRASRTPTPYSRDRSSDASSLPDGLRPKLCKSAASKDASRRSPDPDRHNLGPTEMDEVLQALRSRNSPVLSQSKERRPSVRDADLLDDLLCCHSKSRRSSLEEICDPHRLRPAPQQVTQVYRAEVPGSPPAALDKADILLGAILRNCDPGSASRSPPVIHSVQRNHGRDSSSSSGCSSRLSPASPDTSNKLLSKLLLAAGDKPALPDLLPRPPSPTPPPDSLLGQLCHDLERKCLISRNNDNHNHQNHNNNVETVAARGRSYSENSLPLQTGSDWFELEPLDMSFEEFDDSFYFTSDGADDLSLGSATGHSGPDPAAGNEAVPSPNKMVAFRKSFDSATSMVFHRHTGLPLTSSPAPMRRGIKFDFDSGINTPKDIKRALFEAQTTDCDHESPKKRRRNSRKLLSTSAPAIITFNNLLGSFEESVLNGRLEPVSTVEGFTAEIGASGTFHPKHLTFPVTVFFYTLCDNNNMASPYLGHINLGKKGYRVPEKGTIQATLFNPLGTVVKMFVVMYDLQDMPPSSQTFIRQRTLYMPSDATDGHKDSQKWLRYLIHLRFASSKSGKIYLHTDIRMIIFRKSDLDTATDHEQGKGFELRSFTHGPSNPKFSPRK